MGIQWVGQEDPCGCGCAAVAMLTGKSYAEVRDHIGGKDLTQRGMSMWDWETVLTELGYATGRLYRVRQYPETNTERAVWPPEPWGDAHLCEVIVAETSHQAHMVVLLRDGTVLDPLTPEPRRLANYARVTSLSVVVKAGDPIVSQPKDSALQVDVDAEDALRRRLLRYAGRDAVLRDLRGRVRYGGALTEHEAADALARLAAT